MSDRETVNSDKYRRRVLGGSGKILLGPGHTKKRFFPSHPKIRKPTVEVQDNELRVTFHELPGWDPDMGRGSEGRVYAYLNLVVPDDGDLIHWRVAQLRRGQHDRGIRVRNWHERLSMIAFERGELGAIWIEGSQENLRTDLYPVRFAEEPEEEPDEPLPTDLTDYVTDPKTTPDLKTEFEETGKITKVRIGAQRFSWEHTKRGQWPEHKPGERVTEGNIVFAFRHRGVHHLRSAEWIGPGQDSKEFDPGAGGDDVGTRIALHMDTDWRPREGEWVGVMLTTMCRAGFRSEVDERTDLVQFQWGVGTVYESLPPDPEPVPPPLPPLPPPIDPPKPPPPPPPDPPEQPPEQPQPEPPLPEPPQPEPPPSKPWWLRLIEAFLRRWRG
jgi:hypothetical protein